GSSTSSSTGTTVHGACGTPRRSSTRYDATSSSTRPLPRGTRGVGTVRGRRRANAASTASAHDSGVRNAETPAARSNRSASGASGTTNAANGRSGRFASATGRTASSGWNRADDPATATTASNSGAVSSTSSAVLITSYLVP